MAFLEGQRVVCRLGETYKVATVKLVMESTLLVQFENVQVGYAIPVEDVAPSNDNLEAMIRGARDARDIIDKDYHDQVERLHYSLDRGFQQAQGVPI